MSSRPNIVVILADDLGFSDLGCYGSEISTPAIDSLARDGLRFTQMYNSARCCPSRAALLTGLHPHQAGIGHMTYTMSDTNPAYQGYLNDSSVTLAEVLGAAGYRTLMSGKWHVARQRNMAERDSWPDERPGFPLPRERGFDDFFGTIGGAGSYYKPTYLMRNEQLLDQTEPDWYYTDQITDHGVRMATEAMDGGEPFFLYLSYTAPHWPLHAHPDDIVRYESHYRGGWDSIRTARHEELKARGLVDPRWPISPRDPTAFPWEESTYPEWEAYRMAIYAAQIDRMDQGVARLLDALRERDQLDNTVIIFLSDNGGAAEFLAEDGPLRPGWIADTTPDGRPMRYGNTPDILPGGPETFQSYDICWANASNTPFRRFKGWVHEGGISTPLIVHWPGRIPEPGVVRTPAHLVDIMPTCLEVAGATYPARYRDNDITPFEGHSLVPAFHDPGWERPGSLFFEHEGYRAIRQGPWKLVSGEEERWELYQIDEDRTESTDLAGREKQRVGRMAGEWNDWAVRVGVNFNLRDDLGELLARQRIGVGEGRARLRRA
ncbi:MAG: arylsulfatase [Acidimicrobiia bacterium]|nr:arylsulfatase [Acidimicrobiia bacterium]MYF84870.1 arylsulfatase [Acidimicrobiia bacterium]